MATDHNAILLPAVPARYLDETGERDIAIEVLADDARHVLVELDGPVLELTSAAAFSLGLRLLKEAWRTIGPPTT
jgi:hypothetical protein